MWRYLKISVWLVVAVCVMMVTHELGHVVGGVLSGGTLQSVELRPWKLPHSTFDPDPFPWVTLWCGPLVGTVLPLVTAHYLRRKEAWFVAWFCVMANGVYVGLSWLVGSSELDGPRLVQHGTPASVLLAYALVTAIGGYDRWRHFLRTIR